MTDAALVDHCLELLAPLGVTRSHRMFGGHALYIDDLCVAIIAYDTLYLKTAEGDRPDYDAAGCRPFTYETRDGERTATGYWSAPDAAMESPAEMIPWARRALAAAVAARTKAPKKRPRAAAAPAKAGAKKVAAKTTAAKTATANKATAKKATAKKAIAKKATAKKPTAPVRGTRKAAA
jgi:DNA transformation protein